MKIAIIGTRGVPARYGGFETAAEEISIGLVKKGHKVYVYCRYDNEVTNHRVYKGVQLHYTPHIDSKNVGTLSHSVFSVFYSLFQNFDLYLFFNVGLAPICIIPKLLGRKVVLNVDGLEWKRKKWGWCARKYFLFCEKIVRFIANVIITDSKAIQKYYFEKYKTSSVFIPYGAHVEKSSGSVILKKYGVKKNEYFLTASRLEPENNADLTIRAFMKLKTNKKLLIAGGANYKSTYIDNLKKLINNDKRIQLLGPIYGKKILKELHCNCYAYIHGNEVGGSNPALLKAMGYRNCVLTLNVPYNSEVVGDSAILFEKLIKDLRNKIQYIIDHPGVIRGYKIKAVRRIKKYYTWKKIISEYEELFKTL